MPSSTRVSCSFPAITLPSCSAGSPVEVTLIAQLGMGAGDQLLCNAGARQAAHPHFIDGLDEPSARLGGMHLAHGDASSLYTFAVGRQGHPFHRHAGPRMFTAIAGSGGAHLRFCTASDAQLRHDPAAFVRALRCVDVPPDALFTVRFGSGTWHQFVSRHPRHPALFALSCHADDRSGALSPAQRARVEAGNADIPSLTETLPPPLQNLLDRTDLTQLPVVSLSLRPPALPLLARLCAGSRALAGRVRAGVAALRPTQGHVDHRAAPFSVATQPAPPADSLLQQALLPGPHQQDYTCLTLPPHRVVGHSARTLLEAVLDGFLHNPPRGVGRLMALRNALVAPLQLRTSALGCPVSSLLSDAGGERFAQRFPVHAQAVDTVDRSAEVLLGADDRHLQFRSCVRVQLLDDGAAVIALGTRVRTRNAFGRCYMLAIHGVHRHYIAPAMLRMAVAHALASPLDHTIGVQNPALA